MYFKLFRDSFSNSRNKRILGFSPSDHNVFQLLLKRDLFWLHSLADCVLKAGSFACWGVKSFIIVSNEEKYDNTFCQQDFNMIFTWQQMLQPGLLISHIYMMTHIQYTHPSVIFRLRCLALFYWKREKQATESSVVERWAGSGQCSSLVNTCRDPSAPQ